MSRHTISKCIANLQSCHVRISANALQIQNLVASSSLQICSNFTAMLSIFWISRVGKVGFLRQLMTFTKIFNKLRFDARNEDPMSSKTIKVFYQVLEQKRGGGLAQGGGYNWKKTRRRVILSNAYFIIPSQIKSPITIRWFLTKLRQVLRLHNRKLYFADKIRFNSDNW